MASTSSLGCASAVHFSFSRTYPIRAHSAARLDAIDAHRHSLIWTQQFLDNLAPKIQSQSPHRVSLDSVVIIMLIVRSPATPMVHPRNLDRQRR